jgi:hypothetical protein
MLVALVWTLFFLQSEIMANYPGGKNGSGVWQRLLCRALRMVDRINKINRMIPVL